MTWFQALILGVVQGLTEFLPVSSSAHLVLVPWALGWRFDPDAAFVFNVLVQLGTLVAVVAYFWVDLTHIVRGTLRAVVLRKLSDDAYVRLGWLILLATFPAVVAGVLLKPLVEQAFGSPQAVSGFLLVTAGLLLVAERLGKRLRPLEAATWLDAVWIGLAQALALFPGISRSGSTIAAGLVRGMQRPAAARFSFLISIPVMIGAGMLAVLDLAALPAGALHVPTLLIGFVAAAIVGYLSIRWMLGFIARHSLGIFSAYCALVGVLGLFVAWQRG